MKKESVNKFDLEAAFKALDEVEIPVVKGILPNRVNLQERFTKKLVTDVLVEDYFNVNDSTDLEAAQEEREAEIAKAKLARIEKIVDLDAESEEDLLPSYVGKYIIQCPQCMTLFYKNEADIEKSEENPEVVNINETCQHCGNTSGYTLIGKVDTVGEDEAENYDVEDFDENELNLDFDVEAEEEPVEETSAEDVAEEETEEEAELTPVEDTEEEVKESLTESKAVLVKGVFTPGEEGDHFEGYHNPTYKWNGWLAPGFEKAECDKIVASINKAAGEDLMHYDAEKDAYVEIYEPDRNEPPYIYKKSDCETTDGHKQLYFIGDGWTWELVEDLVDEKDEAAKESLTEAAGLNLQPAILSRFLDKRQLANLTPEEIKILQEPLENRAEVDKIIAKYNEAKSLNLDPAIAARFTTAQLNSLTPEEIKILQDPSDREGKDKIIAKYNPKNKLDEGVVARETDQVCSVVLGDKQVFTGTKEECEKYINEHECEASRVRGGFKLLDTAKVYVNESIDKDLDAKLKAHNDYIEYLKKMIEQEEKALSKADNEYVKKAIQRSIDALKADLEEALPEVLKNEVETDLPTPEEADLEATENKEEPKEKKESLTEATEKVSTKKVDTLYPVVNTDMWGNERQVLAGTKEECQKKLDNIKRNSPKSLADRFSIKQGAEVPVVSEDESLTETASQGAFVSKLKRNYSATEIMVKELKNIEPFNRLSTRTIQRVLLPYYIENMGRDGLSTQALVDFFEYEGFAPYVLDHFMTMDPQARKELLRADEKFMQIFNDYATAYNFFPGKDETLEPGESEFDYAFSIIFGIDADGLTRDVELTRDAVKSLGKMYAEGRFDKSLIVEELTEDTALDTLFNSEEFKTPISDAEIDKIRAKYEGLEEDIAPGIETEIAINNIVDTWESLEDLHEESLNKLTTDYLTEVYSNVKSFETTACSISDNKLVVEGTINFNSGKSKSTTFVYESKGNLDGKLIFEGLNADFATDKAFVLSCKIDTANCLIAESLNYKYTINDTLVEGLLK